MMHAIPEGLASVVGSAMYSTIATVLNEIRNDPEREAVKTMYLDTIKALVSKGYEKSTFIQ